MTAFVAGWSKEFHSKEHLLISYNRNRHTCRNKSFEKLDTYSSTCFGDSYANFEFKVVQSSREHS